MVETAMENEKFITFRGIKFPIELKGIVDYYDKQPDDIHDDVDVIAKNPLGIDGYIKFKEVVRQYTISTIHQRISNEPIIQNYIESQKSQHSLEAEITKFKHKLSLLKEQFDPELHSMNEILNFEKEINALDSEVTLQIKPSKLIKEIEFVKTILSAAECESLGLNHASIACLELGMNDIFNSEEDNKKLFKANEIASKAKSSLLANKKRHAKNNKIKEHAIELYNASTFPSVRNAAQKLAPIIMNYAENDPDLKKMDGTDKKFTCPFQTADTLERWIGKHKRLQAAKI